MKSPMPTTYNLLTYYLQPTTEYVPLATASLEVLTADDLLNYTGNPTDYDTLKFCAQPCSRSGSSKPPVVRAAPELGPRASSRRTSLPLAAQRSHGGRWNAGRLRCRATGRPATALGARRLISRHLISRHLISRHLISRHLIYLLLSRLAALIAVELPLGPRPPP